MVPPPPHPPYSPIQPQYNLQKRSRRAFWSASYVTLISIGGIGALLVLLAGLLSGALGLASILAAVPTLAVVVFTFVYLDRLEPEPLSAQVWALLWGATVAVSGSLLLEFLLITAGGIGEYGSAVVVAPLVEEALKGVAIYVLWKHRVVTGVLNAVIYGGLSAAGFAFIENIGYFLDSSSNGGGAALLVVIVLRGIVTPFAHPLFTAFTAFGVGYAIKTSRKGYALLGFPVAVLTHATWNHLASESDNFADIAQGFLVVMVPIFIAVSAVVLRLRKQERQQLQHAAALMQDVLPPAMAPLLWDPRARSRFARDWAAHGRSKASLRAYISALTHLANARSEEYSGVSQTSDELTRTVLELSPWR